MAIITEAHVKEYNSAVTHLAQQRFSKLRGAVLNDTLNGEEGYYEQLGPSTMDPVTSRHGDTPITNPDHVRRRVVSNPYAKARLVDSFDAARVLIDPAGNYAMSQAMGAGRQIDQIIIDCLDATAYGGKDGTSTFAPLPAMEVAVGSTDLTVDKLLLAQTYLLDQGNDPDIEPWYLACTAYQLQTLLKDPEVTSADYNTVKALVNGQINSYMGFEFIVFGRTAGRVAALPKTGNNRSCFAWARSGVVLASAEEVTTTVDRRPDKLNSVQVLTKMDCGATRLEEEKVVHILCDETA